MRLDLDGLADASREALMSEWRAVVGRPAPKHLSKPLMIQILSHAYLVDTVGGYTKRLDSRLKSAARRDVVRPAFKPGSRFVREYHGITMWLRWVMTGALCGTSRALSPSLIQHAPLLVITSQAFSSLGYAHECSRKARNARSCLYPQKLWQKRFQDQSKPLQNG